MAPLLKYQVESTKNAGRTLVASVAIARQDLVLTDTASVVSPILSGPVDDFSSGLFCITCFKKIPATSKKCTNCNLPICDLKCSKNPVHKLDCPVLKDMFDDEEEGQQQQQVRKPFGQILEQLLLASSCLGSLRLLRLRREQQNPISILENSRPSGCDLSEWEQDVVEMLAGCNLLTNDNVSSHDVITEEEVTEALGIWATNGVKVQRSSAHLPCGLLFPQFCLVNHNCVPAAMYVPYWCSEANQYQIDLRAQADLHTGQEITVRYTDALATTEERLAATSQKWGFTCFCTRCTDPSEVGTFAGALQCTKCSTGYLLFDLTGSNWKCDRCGTCLKNSCVKRDILDNLFDCKLHALTSLDPQLMEHWLFAAQKTLHVNHAWILDVEYRLMFTYAQKLKTMKKKKRPIQDRMVQIGIHLLEILDKIDPGPTRWRGMIMQELVTPWMDVSKDDKKNGIIDGAQFKNRVVTGVLYAQNAVDCLKNDPKNKCIDFSLKQLY